jgi:O-Antigen ligase
MKHALTVAVAVAYLAISLPDGGYPPEAIAAGTLMIWWAVIVGLAVGAWPRAAVPQPAARAGLCIAGLALLTGLSMLWASDDGRAFIELVRVAGYAGLFALVILASPEGSARSWLVGLAIGLVAVAALALGSRFEPSLPGGDQGLGEALPTARGRLSYPLGYWNALGACMALGTVLLAWLGARAQTRRGRAIAIGTLPPVLLALYLTSSRGGFAAAAVGLTVLLALGPARLRLASGLALAVPAGALLVGLAELRSELVDDPGSPVARFAGDEILLATVIIAIAAGLLRYAADAPLARLSVPARLGRLRELRERKTLVRVAAAVAAVVVLLAVIAANPAQRLEDFRSTPPDPEAVGNAQVATRIASGSGSGRYQFWSAAVDAFASEPVTGIGAGGYEAFWNRNGDITRTVRNAHSLFLETLGELGVVGLVLIGSFLVIGAVQGWRRRAGGSPGGVVEVTLAILAAGILSAAVDWTWELPAAFVPVVIAVALLVGPATLRAAAPSARARARTAGSDGAPEGEPPRRSFGWGVATLLAGWAAVWIAGVLLLTEVKLDDSRAAFDRGDVGAAAQDATDATTLQPWAAEPWLELALVQERARNVPAARAAIANAIDRAPNDWSLWWVAGRIENLGGDPEAAQDAFTRARTLYPRAPIFAQGDPD